MKNILMLLGVLGFLTNTFAFGAEPAGSGTPEAPWQIDSLANLAWISETPEVWNDHFVQTSDIEATETRSWNVVDGYAQGFMPIGGLSKGSFSGNYNGRGYKIRDLYINQPNGMEVGLFGGLSEARIDSVGLVRADVSGYANIGILAGRSYQAYITNTFVEGRVEGGRLIGAFTGRSNLDTLEKTWALAHVFASEGGGYIGGSDQPSSVARSYFAGVVTNTSGGIDVLTYTLFPSFSGIEVQNFFALGDLNSLNYVMPGDSNVYVYLPGYQLARYRPRLPHSFRQGDKGLFLGMDTLFSEFSGVGDDLYDYHEEVTLLSKMKSRVNFPTYDFINSDADGVEDIWAIKENESLPYLFDLDAPVFAFADTLSFIPNGEQMTQETIDLLVANDVDPDDSEAELAARWIEGARYSGDSVLALYQAGTIKGPDTMWAGISTVVFPQHRQIIEISSYEELKQIGWGTKPVDGAYRLIADIEAKASYNENNGKGFSPLCRARDPFRGELNGGGHRIINLYLKAPYDFNVGFFRAMENARIDSLALINISLNGGNTIASLAGKSDAVHVNHSVVSGNISGGRRVGGLLGNAYDGFGDSSSISNSYFFGLISAEVNRWPSSEVGGLVAAGDDELINSYSSSLFWINGLSSDSIILPVGDGWANCNNIFQNHGFWNTGLSVANSTCEFLGLRSPELLSQLSYTNWDFTGNIEDGAEDVWRIVEGQSMPYLAGLDNPPFAMRDTLKMGQEDLGAMSTTLVDAITANDIDPDNPTADLTIRWTDKSKTSGDTLKLHYQVGSLIDGDTIWGAFSWVIFTDAPYPLVINSYEDLKKIGDPQYPLWNLSASYELGSDIDASESVAENGGAGFTPIGAFGEPSEGTFTGVFDGKGHVITNLHIRRNSIRQAFFNTLSHATIKNLGIVNANISGNSGVAILAVDIFHSKIHSVYVEGEVQGMESAGMLAQVSEYSVFEECYAGGVLDVYRDAAGMLMYTNNDTIRNSYSTVYLPNMHHEYPDQFFLIGREVGYATDTVNTYLSNTYAFEEKMSSINLDSASGYPGFDFENTWAIREDSTMPALRTVNNAPFAFDDMDSVGASFDMKHLLKNDFDYEKVQDSLVYKVIKPANLDLTGHFFVPGDDFLIGDTLVLTYRVGELLSNGDTLWGNFAKAKLNFVENHRPVPTIPAEKVFSTELNTSLILPLDTLGYDPDGDALFYAFPYHAYHGTEEVDLETGVFIYTPDSGYVGSDSLQISIGDGAYNMTGWMHISVLDSAETNTTDPTDPAEPEDPANPVDPEDPGAVYDLAMAIGVNAEIQVQNHIMYIALEQSTAASMVAELYNASGKLVQKFDFGRRLPGNHQLIMDLPESGAAVYYVVLYHNGEAFFVKSLMYSGH